MNGFKNIGLPASVLVPYNWMVLHTATRRICFPRGINHVPLCLWPSLNLLLRGLRGPSGTGCSLPPWLHFLPCFLPPQPCLPLSVHWLSGLVWPRGLAFADPHGHSALPANLHRPGFLLSSRSQLTGHLLRYFLYCPAYSYAPPPTPYPYHCHISSSPARCSYVFSPTYVETSGERICWWLFPHTPGAVPGAEWHLANHHQRTDEW